MVCYCYNGPYLLINGNNVVRFRCSTGTKKLRRLSSSTSPVDGHDANSETLDGLIDSTTATVPDGPQPTRTRYKRAAYEYRNIIVFIILLIFLVEYTVIYNRIISHFCNNNFVCSPVFSESYI